MKKLVTILALTLALSLIATQCFAGWVNGYTRRNGTYVQGHYRSDPNSTVRDNYSYKGNTNPYTGATGTNYYRNSPSSEYYGTSSGNSIFNTSNWGAYFDTN